LRKNHSGMETLGYSREGALRLPRCVRTIVVWKLIVTPNPPCISVKGCVRTIVVWKLKMVKAEFLYQSMLRKNHSGMETDAKPRMNVISVRVA